MPKRKPSGMLYRRGKKGIYYLEYVVNGKRFKQSLRTTDTDEAKRERERILAPILTADMVAKRTAVAHAIEDAMDTARRAEAEAKARIPLADMWGRFPYTTNARGTPERPLSASTVRDNKSQWGKFLSWSEGEGLGSADQVTPAVASTFRDHLKGRDLSGDRVNKIVGLCCVMFRNAGIEPNPFDGIRRLAHRSQGRLELTEEELLRLGSVATGEMRVLLAIGLHTGLRLADAATLRWNAVSPDLSRIVLEPSKTRHRGRELVIPTNEHLADVLSSIPDGERQGDLLPELAALYRKDRGIVSKRIQAHFESCGIRTHREGTGKQRDPETGNIVDTGRRAVVEKGFHSLRHSFVSICARQGVPLHVVQALCGHSSPQVQRLYLHHSTEDTSRAVAALADYTSRSRTELAKLRARAHRIIDEATELQLRAWLSEDGGAMAIGT